jgi:hypothetical protein
MDLYTMTIRNIITDQNEDTKYLIVAKAYLDESFQVERKVKCIIRELKPFNYHSLGNSLLKREKPPINFHRKAKRIIQLNNILFIDANIFIFHENKTYSLAQNEGLLKLRALTEKFEIKQIEP